MHIFYNDTSYTIVDIPVGIVEFVVWSIYPEILYCADAKSNALRYIDVKLTSPIFS